MFNLFLEDYKSINSHLEVSEKKEAPLLNQLLGAGLIFAMSYYIFILVWSVLTRSDHHRICSFCLFLILLLGSISIVIVNKQLATDPNETPDLHLKRIVLLMQLIEKEEYGLDLSLGIDWLISECIQRMKLSSVRFSSGSMISYYFEKLIYPIAAFLCGQIANQLTFTGSVGTITRDIVSIIMIILVILIVLPVLWELLNQDQVILAELLDDLSYLKSSRLLKEHTTPSTCQIINRKRRKGG